MYGGVEVINQREKHDLSKVVKNGLREVYWVCVE